MIVIIQLSLRWGHQRSVRNTSLFDALPVGVACDETTGRDVLDAAMYGLLSRFVAAMPPRCSLSTVQMLVRHPGLDSGETSYSCHLLHDGPNVSETLQPDWLYVKIPLGGTPVKSIYTQASVVELARGYTF